jgi:hypothetical protein
MFAINHSNQFLIIFDGHTNLTQPFLIVYDVPIILARVWNNKRSAAFSNRSHNSAAGLYFKAVVF